MGELAEGAGWPGVDLEVGGEGGGGRGGEFVKAGGRGVSWRREFGEASGDGTDGTSRCDRRA